MLISRGGSDGAAETIFMHMVKKMDQNSKRKQGVQSCVIKTELIKEPAVRTQGKYRFGNLVFIRIDFREFIPLFSSVFINDLFEKIYSTTESMF